MSPGRYSVIEKFTERNKSSNDANIISSLPTATAMRRPISPRNLAAELSRSMREIFSAPYMKDEDESTQATGSAIDDEKSISILPSPKLIGDCILTRNEMEEWGRVKFRFDGNSFEHAKELCKDTGKPIFIFFHDGSREAASFGQIVLSHPLVVETIETFFLPVIINSNGTCVEESKVAARYCAHRSSTMVRIVNEKGNDLVVKLEDDMCNMANICDIMIKSLQRKEIPPLMYLKLLKKEKQALNPRGKSHAEDPQEIVLSTKSIVRAELDFADAEGVVATQVGKIGSTEVIKVTYDSVATAQSFEGIIRHALFHHDLQRIFCINKVQEEAAQKEILKFEVTHIKISLLRPTEIIKPIRITKIFLQRDSWRFMPLTPFQATLVNLTLWKGRPDVAASLLSPRQRAILEALETKHARRSAIDVDISLAWDRLEADGVFCWL